MDNIDTAILDCLKENGRVTASEISKKVKLSIPAVAERIRKLEQNSIIQKYTIKLDRRQTGYNFTAVNRSGLSFYSANSYCPGNNRSVESRTGSSFG